MPLPGKMFVKYCNETDNKRVQKAKRKSIDATKEARKQRRQKEREKEERRAPWEGTSYAASALPICTS